MCEYEKARWRWDQKRRIVFIFWPFIRLRLPRKAKEEANFEIAKMNQIPPFSHMLHSGLLTNRKIVFSPVFFSRPKNLAYVYSDVENAKRVVFNFSRVKTRGGANEEDVFFHESGLSFPKRPFPIQQKV